MTAVAESQRLLSTIDQAGLQATRVVVKQTLHRGSIIEDLWRPKVHAKITIPLELTAPGPRPIDRELWDLRTQG